jgi:hypothetical protein
MKYILSLLTALSMLLLSSCGGGSEVHDHNGTEAGECCGADGECCKDANASE